MVRGAVAALVLARGFDVIKPMLVRAVLVDLRHGIQARQRSGRIRVIPPYH